jgi:hypothetical protein
MLLKTTANVSPVIRSIERYAMATSLDFEQSALRLTRGFMRRVVGITPPATGSRGAGGILTSADKKRGEEAIARDLGYIFDPQLDRAKRDVAMIHRKRFLAAKRPGRRLSSGLPPGQRWSASVEDLENLYRELVRNVGKLASGWLAGVDAVKATGVPAWVRRHGASRGKAKLVVSLSRTSLARTHGFSFVAANTSVHPDIVPDLNRRIGYAMTYASNGLNRETNAILAKRGQQFGRI